MSKDSDCDAVQFASMGADIGYRSMTMLQEQTIGEEQPAAGGADRRRSHREPVVTAGTLRLASDKREGGRQVLVHDVSLHGVGMRTTFQLELDDVFMIEIGVGPLRLSSRLRVARVRPLKDGTYDIGGEFC
jgi:hypothetical protein